MNRKLSAFCGGLIVASSVARAGIAFTIENSGVQHTSVAGATTETFETVSTGTISSYSSTLVDGVYTSGEVINHNVYGGAGGTGRYDVVGLGSTTTQTLEFNSPKTYFGLWWSAGDAANSLKFYNGSTLLNEFHIGDILPSLNSNYFGNPNGGGNTSEAYVYLNFTATESDFITKVIFGNLTQSGFESDNHSVYDQRISPPGHEVGAPDSGAAGWMFGVSALGIVALRARLAPRAAGRNRAD